MAKIYPNASPDTPPPQEPEAQTSISDGRKASSLTVWRKSLLFNGNGFTVFDSFGNLVFRVDNYSSESRAEIVLMDAAGKPLLTIRKKKLSLGENWLIYNGEEVSNPRFAVKKHMSLLSCKVLAQVTSCSSSSGAQSCLAYNIEGSYSQRCCAVYDSRGQKLAEVKKKENAKGIAFGVDVFRLIVEPEFDTSFAMAIVILLDQMYVS